MEGWEIPAVVLAGLVAGVANAMAGGGTLVAYPALVWIGLDPVVANATSTLALWPGYVTATIGFRRDLAGTGRLGLALLIPSLLGGLGGAILLLETPDRVFEDAVPFLVLGATVLLLWQDAQERGRTPSGGVEGGANQAPPRWSTAAIGLTFAAAVYGGYFGAGLGFLLLASLGAVGMRRFLQATGFKNALTVLINGVALAYFVALGAVEWVPGLVMSAGAITGGFLGAGLTRRVGGEVGRRVVVVLGLVISVVLFVQAR